MVFIVIKTSILLKNIKSTDVIENLFSCLNEKTKLSDAGFKEAACTNAADGSKTYEVKAIKFDDELIVIVDPDNEAPTTSLTSAVSSYGIDNADKLAEIATVYYADAAKTKSPVGLEYNTAFMYDNGSEAEEETQTTP